MANQLERCTPLKTNLGLEIQGRVLFVFHCRCCVRNWLLKMSNDRPELKQQSVRSISWQQLEVFNFRITQSSTSSFPCVVSACLQPKAEC